MTRSRHLGRRLIRDGRERQEVGLTRARPARPQTRDEHVLCRAWLELEYLVLDRFAEAEFATLCTMAIDVVTPTEGFERFTSSLASVTLDGRTHRKSNMKALLTLALVSFAAPLAVAQHPTDPPPKNVEVYKSKGPEKAVMHVSPSGKAVVVTPGRDAQGGPPPGPQRTMKFPDPEKPLKRETTTVYKETSSKSTEAKSTAPAKQ